MEVNDDNELNKMLDNALLEAKRIGMRGEIIDMAATLRFVRNNILQEMMKKVVNSDEEDDQMIEMNDDDKVLDVFDERYNKYIIQSAEELGLTTEVEHNLGFHPDNADYLKISNLNLNYVKKNMKEA
jgi:hypothetical protein